MSAPLPLDEPALACLFAGHSRVDGLRALYEWAAAVDDLVRLGTTEAHTVAHHKWQWWQEEIERLRAGTPRHPLTQRLAAAAPEPGLWALLPERLELAQFELAGVAPDDAAAAERWDWRREGVLEATAIQLLTGAPLPADDMARAMVQALARALGRLAASDAPAHHAARGRLGLPLEALEAAGIPLEQLPAALQSPRHRPALSRVIATQLGAAEDALRLARNHWQRLPRQSPYRLAHTAVRLALAEQRLRRLQRLVIDEASAGLPATRPDVPPPWRSLWTAWNAARRAGRH